MKWMLPYIISVANVVASLLAKECVGMTWCVGELGMAYLLISLFSEGYNFWEEAYKTYELPEDVTLKDDPDDATSNISSRAFKYIRPFSKVRINNRYMMDILGLKANYLSPVAINEMRLASPR